MAKQDRVHWTETERQKVLTELARLGLADPKATIKELFFASQLVLPEERRRPWSGKVHTLVHEALPSRPRLTGIGRRLGSKNKVHAAPPPPAQEPAQEPEQAQPVELVPFKKRGGRKKGSKNKPKGPLVQLEAPPTPEPAPLQIPPVVVPPVVAPAPPPGWIALTADAIAQVIAQVAVDPRVQAAFRLLTARETPPAPAPTPEAPAQPVAPAHNPAPISVKRDRKPHVVVAGMKGHQPEEIRADFATRLKISFWGTHESSDRLRDLASHCDVCVGMTDFLGHPADQIMHSRAPKYVRVHGGITAIKLALERIYAESMEPTTT